MQPEKPPDRYSLSSSTRAVTAMTGMDALCHAVEAYTNDKYNSDTERELCRKAVRLIYENLLKVYENGSDIEARQKMQIRAFAVWRRKYEVVLPP